MGGLAQAPSSQPSRDANSGWLPGWATPNSSSQPTATTQAASRVKPLPDAPGSHRVKRELVPTPRKDETQSMPQNEVKGELVPSPRKDETRSVPQSAGVQTTLDHYEKATATATAPKVGTQNPIEQHVGVGMRIQDDPPHKIISLVPGGPAARSGSVQVGDYLLSVQDVDIQNLSAANIRSLIVGPDGSSVTLKLKKRPVGSGRTPEGHEEVCSVTVIREPAMKGALKAATLQSKTYKELHATFKRFDSNGSGRIDRTEMKKVLAALGFPASEAEVQRMINQSSPRATIDFATFLTILGMSPP